MYWICFTVFWSLLWLLQSVLCDGWKLRLFYGVLLIAAGFGIGAHTVRWIEASKQPVAAVPPAQMSLATDD